MVASRDMASIRAVTAAMDTYEKLGYSKDKIKFVLNTPAPFPHSGLTREKIEGALRVPAVATIPYVPEVLVDAINLGQPLVSERPDEPHSGMLEDLAFRLSNEAHKKNKPVDPTDTWMRVYKRYQERKK